MGGFTVRKPINSKTSIVNNRCTELMQFQERLRLNPTRTNFVFFPEVTLVRDRAASENMTFHHIIIMMVYHHHHYHHQYHHKGITSQVISVSLAACSYLTIAHV